MLRAMSSYIYIKKRLHPGLLDAMKRGGAQAVEVFAARGHFNYTDKEHIKELSAWFKSEGVELHSMHSPIYMSNDFRSGGAPLNIVDGDKPRRIDAMDEIKRAVEVAEQMPFRFLVQHIGKSDEYDDPRKFEWAMSGIEHLRAFCRQLGVTLLVENTPNDLATPEKLKELLKTLHYPDLGVCFDTGHAHMTSSVHQAFSVLEPYIRSTHVHDNKRDKDAHLWPGEGSIEWNETMQSLRNAPHSPAVLMEIEGEEGLDVSGKMAEAYKKLETATVEVN
ncbi:MAG TPA: sugar phosphate isomerase/epimerase family protein [Candidatus Acidoferrales bacterium]|jgi:sugar phosphate isomerase/epimerase|nr:sugar phosphate isomerase/epimerase family protein [Candidatus Acidoferrales bacterium]